MNTRVDDEKVLHLEDKLKRVDQADTAEHDERPTALLRIVMLERHEKVALGFGLLVESQIRLVAVRRQIMRLQMLQMQKEIRLR